MRVSELVVERRIAAPVEAVWRTLTDPDRVARALRSVERVEPLTEGPPTVGTRWRETRRVAGRQTVEDMLVTAYEPGARLVVESEAQGVRHVWEFTFLVYVNDGSQQPPSTTVRVAYVGRGPERGLGRILARLLGGVDVKAAERRAIADLRDLAAAVEQPLNQADAARTPSGQAPA